MTQARPKLLVITSAPVYRMGAGYIMDIKFVEGMRCYANIWDGPVECLVKSGDTLPFSDHYFKVDLPFCLKVIEENEDISINHLEDCDVVLCSGDANQYFSLHRMVRANSFALVYVIENTLAARCRVVVLDRKRGWIRKIYSLLHLLKDEILRIRALQSADAVQANGYPAFESFRKLNPNTLMYLDSRIKRDILVTDTEMADRAARALCGAPLRLVHSGQLEPHKGSQDLVPLALQLIGRGIPFTLDIFGSGTLDKQIRSQVAQHGLQGYVRVHGVLDFETELVPFARSQGDIFVSCHRQSDPSCTYLESMGCGLAVVGYTNEMWAKLNRASGAGWSAPLGSVRLLAEAIAAADRDRTGLVKRMHAARSFAADHCFEAEFAKRIAHLRGLLTPSQTVASVPESLS
jgi:colanic acid/amylovoran biosynthesis glycosyltransferase